MTQIVSNPLQRPQIDFQTDLKNVARALRSSLSDLMTSAGLDPHDPKALNRKWGINKTLSWKVSRIIQTDDAFLALQQLPGKEGVEILLKKGRDAGLDSRYVEATQEAVERFDRLVEAHCGDRTTFDMMGSDLSTVGRLEREEAHRKQFFQGGSYVWGVQTRVCLNMRFVSPSAGPDGAGKVDFAHIAGLLDFRRLRENAPWIMSRRLRKHDDRTHYPLKEVEPLDPASEGQVVPLMTEFCSQPLPALNITRSNESATVELAPGQVGNAGVLTYVTGSIERSIPQVRTAQDRNGSLWAISSTPSELMVFDVFFHNSLSYAIPPRPALSSLIGPLTSGGADHTRYNLPMYEPLIDLGPAAPSPVTPEVPRYREMLQMVFDRTGWNARDFRGFRIKMAYPPVPAALMMAYPLPESAE